MSQPHCDVCAEFDSIRVFFTFIAETAHTLRMDFPRNRFHLNADFNLPIICQLVFSAKTMSDTYKRIILNALIHAWRGSLMFDYALLSLVM